MLNKTKINLNSTILKTINESFRVENRKAKPKIIKNINNIQNIFIMPTKKDSNNSVGYEKTKRLRRNVTKSNEVHNLTEIRPTEEKTPIKDDYYFTFYNDKTATIAPPSTNPDINTPEVQYVKHQRKVTLDYTPDTNFILSSNFTYQHSH